MPVTLMLFSLDDSSVFSMRYLKTSFLLVELVMWDSLIFVSM